jgi:hypothetical protein
MARHIALLMIWAVLAICAPASAVTIWIEGEDATVSRFVPFPQWYDQVNSEALSGGEWLGHFSAEKGGTASYDIRLPEESRYVLWLRANPTRNALSYRMDAGEWQLVDSASAREVENVAADGAIDLRFIGWVRAGAMQLDAGEHTLHVKVEKTDTPEHHGAVDVVVLTSDNFYPTGLTRPEQVTQGRSRMMLKPQLDEDNSWAFRPAEDPFSDDCVTDLSHLNEDVAGQTGFIGLSEDGMSFVKGDGTPIRFWSAVSEMIGMTPEEQEVHCRWLAKMGVNMVRVGTDIADTSEGASITDVNEERVDRIMSAVAAAKRNGIYVTLSPFWPHATAPASWNIPGYADQQAWAIFFFNQRCREAYKGWVRELYTRPNPYTGILLKDEPAIAIVQTMNEDSLLFYTVDGVREPQAAHLRKLHGDWLKAKYGSLEAAREAWGPGAEHEDDDFASGEVGLPDIWLMTSEAPPPDEAHARRYNDQLQFLAELQRDFYDEMEHYYKEVLACQQITNSMNWRSADPVLLEDAERWTYMAADVVALNRYTGGPHVGAEAAWRIDANHVYANQSVLKDPGAFPGAVKQVVGAPFIVTETAWVSPELYQSEGPFLAAAYNSLTGVDTFYWFSYGAATWATDIVWPWWRGPGDTNSLRKFVGPVPVQAGMFPALALAFRRGDVQAAAEPVVYEERALEDIWKRRVPLIAEAGKFDPNRDAGVFAPESPIKQEVDRLAFLVGPVHVKYGGDAANNRVADLGRYLDAEAGVVRSVTG